MCQCECGNITISIGKEMRGSNIVSCGCSKTERIKALHYNDLSGQRFGSLVVLEDYGRQSGHSI